MATVILRNARMKNRHVAIEYNKPLGRSFKCRRCGNTHSKKTIHARSDLDGRIAVSEGAFQDWADAGLGAWKYVETVDDPPRRGAIQHG